MTLAASAVVAGAVNNPTDTYRFGRSIYYCGENVGKAFGDLGKTFYHKDPSYLGSCVWRVADAVGVVGDVPIYAVAVGVSWIPVVNRLPIGWTWAKLRRQE